MKNLYLITAIIILNLFPLGILNAQQDDSFINEKVVGNSNNTIDISLYPVPTKDRLNITFSFAPFQEPSITVYDLLGNLIQIETPTIETANSYSINLSDKKAGYYFLKIKTDETTFARRITVVH